MKSANNTTYMHQRINELRKKILKDTPLSSTRDDIELEKAVEDFERATRNLGIDCLESGIERWIERHILEPLGASDYRKRLARQKRGDEQLLRNVMSLHEQYKSESESLQQRSLDERMNVMECHRLLELCQQSGAELMQASEGMKRRRENHNISLDADEYKAFSDEWQGYQQSKRDVERTALETAQRVEVAQERLRAYEQQELTYRAYADQMHQTALDIQRRILLTSTILDAPDPREYVHTFMAAKQKDGSYVVSIQRAIDAGMNVSKNLRAERSESKFDDDSRIKKMKEEVEKNIDERIYSAIETCEQIIYH